MAAKSNTGVTLLSNRKSNYLNCLMTSDTDLQWIFSSFVLTGVQYLKCFSFYKEIQFKEIQKFLQS